MLLHSDAALSIKDSTRSGNRLRVSKLHLNLLRRLSGCFECEFRRRFSIPCLVVRAVPAKSSAIALALPPVFGQMQFDQFSGIVHQSRQIGRDAPLRLGQQ